MNKPELDLAQSLPRDTSPKEKIDSLISLRFFAAFYVFLFHIVPLWFPSLVANSGPVRSFILAGYTGVTFFYLLSGYVLTYGYEESLSCGRVTAKEFWMRRLVRLWPILLFSLALGFLPLFGGLNKEGSGAFAAATWYFFTNAFFLGAWFPETLRINYPVWSISVEAFFYLSFPAVIFFTRNYRARFFHFLLVWLLAISFVLVPAIFVPEILSARGDNPGAWMISGSHSFLRNFLEVNPIVHFPSFLAGVVLHKIHSSKVKWNLGLGGFLFFSGLTLASLFFSHLLPFALLHNGLLLPLFAGLIFYAIDWPPLRRAISNRALVLLGESSCALYLIHVPLRDWFSFFSHRAGVAVSPDFPFRAGLAMTVIVFTSIAFFLYLERPLVALFRDRIPALKK